MPTSQVSSNSAGGVQPSIENVVVANRPPPPPSKLPPPPPPPKNNRPLPIVPTLQNPPPPPPPPPPPRNSSQIGCNSISNPSNIPLQNNVTSVNSPGGCVGRCSGRGGANPDGMFGIHPPTPNQRGFTRHGECGSRSSVSSRSSMSHHYHGAGACHGTSSNNIGAHMGPVVHCNHQQPIGGCTWSAANQLHSHVNSSNVSDNGKCNTYHDQGVGCCSHQPTVPNKFQSQTSANSLQTTTISRSTLYPDELDDHHTREPHCNGDHPPQMINQPLHHHNHHHHHHNHHHELPSHSVQANQDPATVPLINDGHRCLNAGPNLEPGMTTQPCCHTHKPHAGCAHQPTGCCEHHGPTNIMQQQLLSSSGPHYNHCSGSCGSHSHNDTKLHHECNTNTPITSKNNLGVSGDSCVHGRHHHHHHHHHPGQCLNHHVQARCQDSFNNAVSPSSMTAHVHNLSNSSTTTHTSNAAVKQQQLQFHHQNHGPTLSRAGRSSSSQHYEQYGLSSAASTSSATASLSSYQTRAGYEDAAGGLPSYPSSRFHQPLPPAPPPPSTTTMPFYHHNHHHALASAKSQPASPSNQMFVNHNHTAGPLITLAPTTINSNVSGQNGQLTLNYQQQQHQQHPTTQQHQQQPQSQSQQPPPPPPALSPHSTLQLHISQHPLPPLPPKPVSPNASSCSTQITTLRTSPVTRITSYAGLEGPIPDSDVPPPPPPLKHGSRNQPLVDVLSKMTLNDDGIGRIDSQQPLEPLLNYSRGGIITDAARKTEDIARQVEMDIEQKRRTSGQPLGVCGICKTNVMPLQAACEAENQIFHTNCFVCFECGRPLQGKKYYPVGDKAYCEEDFKYSGHMKSLEKCAACAQPIFDMILPALNKFYHPNCFKCCVCHQCLDGVPFTIDRKNNIYCVRDYHNIHSPKCAKCGKPISPIDGTSETVRVVSMDKDYHVDCYCCEDCGLQLTDEEPSRCFPLDNHLLCQTCHINRLTAIKPAMSLN